MKGSPRLAKLIERYKIFAVIVLNTILMIVILNFIAGTRLEKRSSSKFSPEYYLDRQDVYPGYTPDDIALLIKETWDKAFQYEPWVGFREKPRSGKFVNISEEGFRYISKKRVSLHDQGIKIFVFGGSTTFGYGVEDAHTIPAYLQQRISVANPDKTIRVFNFGRAYYYSAPELILLLELLRKEYLPDIAVFIDGWNEGPQAPYYADEMSFLFDAYNYTQANLNKIAFENVPLVRYIQEKWGSSNSRQSFRRTKWHNNPGEIRNEYLKNREIISLLAKEYRFAAYFFIHPVPGYRNSFATHRFWKNRTPESVKAITAKMQLLEGTVNADNAFSMTGLLEHYPNEPFVDAIHFTPAVCDLMAEFITQKIQIEETGKHLGK